MRSIPVIIGSVLVAGAVAVPAASALADTPTHPGPAVTACQDDAPPLPLPIPGAPSASPTPSEPGNGGGGGGAAATTPTGGGSAVTASIHCRGA